MIEIVVAVAAQLAFFLAVGFGVDRWIWLREKVRARSPHGRIGRAARRFGERRKRGAIYLTAFTAFTVGLLIWLVAGLAPVIVHASDSLHERLHRWGGVQTPVQVEFRDFSFSRAEMTFRSNGPARLVFRSTSDVPHNLSIYRDADATVPIFQGPIMKQRFGIKPFIQDEWTDEHAGEEEEFYPNVQEFTFEVPEPGSYVFRCDVHPQMRGGVRVVGPAVGPTQFLLNEDVALPKYVEVTPRLSDLWRRLAEASHGAERGWQVGFEYFFTILNLGLAILLVWLRPRDRVARWFGAALLATAAAYNLQSHAARAVIPGFSETLHDNFIHPLATIPYLFAMVLFPDGRLVPRFRTRLRRIWFAQALFVTFAVSLAALGAFSYGSLDHYASFVQVFGIAVPVVGLIAQRYRVRRADTAERRQQSRLLMWAVLPALIAGVTFTVISLLSGDAETFGFGPVTSPLSRATFYGFQPLFGLIPIALFIGILRYRLFDLDVVISKALVFGSLAAFIGAVYVGVVASLSALAPGARSTLSSVVAMVIVAVAFQPLRERMRRVADRLVYGERATPYEVMARFSNEIAEVLSVEEVLPRMAEVAGRGVRASSSRVSVFLPGGTLRSVAWPDQSGTDYDHVIDVTHLGERVGEIAIAKPAGDRMTHEDETVLQGLASQAGVAMSNVRLAAELDARLNESQEQAKELAASRARIVTARVTERRRLGREISVDVERGLLTVDESLAQARALVATDSERATLLLDVVRAQATEALESLRELARGQFPPLLADRGLGPAVEAQARKHGETRVRLGDGIEGARFDRHVEAAVYFCVAEALLNASKYAPGAAVSITVTLERGVVGFEITDEGAGFDPADVVESIGLQQMRDRVQALGGQVEVVSAPGAGTTVRGGVPVVQPPLEAAAQAPMSLSGANDALGM